MMLPALKVATAFIVVHMWYENDCCSNQDCRPVNDGTVRELKEGVDVAGYGTLTYSDPRLRWSRDNSDHLCIGKSGLRCVYRKPKGM